MYKSYLIAGILGVIAFIGVGVLLVVMPVENTAPLIHTQQQVSQEEYIYTTLHSLTLEDKIRQMMIWTVTGPEVSKEDIDVIKKLRPGGIMISGSMNHTDLLRITVQLHSLKTKVPVIIAIDQEGGEVKRLSEDPLSNQKVLGITDDKVFCKSIKDSSRWLSELGVNLNFGIVGDIAWTPESYMYGRSYGSDPGTVAKHVVQAIQCNVGVMTTIKHFPGHGRAIEDSHTTIPSIPLSYAEWAKTDAIPFKAAIQEKVDAVMVGHLVYPDIASDTATLSPVYSKELRKIGFNGLIITDDMGMLENSGLDPKDSFRKAMLAGNDMILYATTKADPEELVSQAVFLVQEKKLSEKKIDEHVQRILKAKYGL